MNLPYPMQLDLYRCSITLRRPISPKTNAFVKKELIVNRNFLSDSYLFTLFNSHGHQNKLNYLSN